MSNGSDREKPALPRKWIVPIRLAVYVALAGSSAYIYYYARELEWTHIIIFLPITAVCAMVLLDCKFSENHWKEQDKIEEQSK